MPHARIEYAAELAPSFDQELAAIAEVADRGHYVQHPRLTLYRLFPDFPGGGHRRHNII